MGNVAQDYLPKKIGQRVPSMKYAADLDKNGIGWFTLGTPALEDTDGILDGSDSSVAGSATTFAAAFQALSSLVNRMDAPYGRNVTVTGSSGSDEVVTITGRDYLGEVMVENITASGTTTIQGNKCFAWIDTVAWTAGTGGATIDVGFGKKLGLPYKVESLVVALEDGMETYPTMQEVAQTVTGVVTNGANAATFTAPFDGFVVGWQGEHTTAMTTAPSVMDATINGSGVAALDGLAPVAVAGLLFGTRIPAASFGSISKGQSFVLTSNAAGTAGVSDLTAFFAKPNAEVKVGDATTQTATTEDVRGSYTPFMTLDGVKEVEIICGFDRDNLHGVAQFAG